MGKRSWEFECQYCGEEFWEWFEQIDRQEAVTTLRTMNCPECKSGTVDFTGLTRFAGGKVQQAQKAGCKCNPCHATSDTFFIEVADRSTLTVSSEIEEMGCPDCGSEDWRVTDQIADVETVEHPTTP